MQVAFRYFQLMLTPKISESCQELSENFSPMLLFRNRRRVASTDRGKRPRTCRGRGLWRENVGIVRGAYFYDVHKLLCFYFPLFVMYRIHATSFFYSQACKLKFRLRELTPCLQRSAKKYANLAKQDPGRARQHR